LERRNGHAFNTHRAGRSSAPKTFRVIEMNDDDLKQFQSDLRRAPKGLGFGS
jgi:hypothetical protein